MKGIMLMTVLWFLLYSASGQSSNGNEAKAQPAAKLYLPAASLDDAEAMKKAIPLIATEILAGLKAKGVPYYRQAATFYLLSGNYPKTLEAIDSVQKANEDPGWRADIKAYATAKIKDADGKHFKEYFQKEYSLIFDKLSFDQKLYMGGMDSSDLKELGKTYKETIDGFKNKKADSITTEEAKDLCAVYRDYTFYNEIYPLMPAYVNDAKYKTSFPAIKGNSWGGVIPVENQDEIPDPTLKYKFVIELTSFAMKDQDSAASKDINLALREVSRMINLHVGAGIPKQNITIVLAVHGSALNAFLNNEKYKKKYEVDNPNLPLLKELQDFGVKIALCGQAMHYQRIPRENFIPGVKVALTAQTVISSYQLKNYVFFDYTLRE